MKELRELKPRKKSSQEPVRIAGYKGQRLNRRLVQKGDDD